MTFHLLVYHIVAGNRALQDPLCSPSELEPFRVKVFFLSSSPLSALIRYEPSKKSYIPGGAL
jgi:hypothetical protein